MTTEIQAAAAARQLISHRRKLPWILERMEFNERLLRGYLQEYGEGLLPGGIRANLTVEGVAAERVHSDRGYVQLELEEAS